MLFSLAYGELIWRAKAPGVDFYQFWAVIKARQLISKDLKSPYPASKQYANCLKIYTDRSSSPLLKEANRIRSNLDLTGTPFLYSIFIILPKNYESALFLYRLIQAVVFIASVILLALTYKENFLPFMAFALLLIVVYEPISQDIWMGNLNAIQFGILSLLAVLALRIKSATEDKDKIIAGIIFVCGLVFFNMLKPNYVLVFLFLMAFLWKTLKTRLFLLTTAAGAIFGILLAAIPCFLFNSVWIWLDWWYQLQRLRADSLKSLYAIEEGNFSTPLLLSKILDIKTEYCFLLTGFFLVLTLATAVCIRIPSRKENIIKRFLTGTSFIFQYPMLCISIGLIITMALSPLIWMHYFVILLLPAIWMIADKSNWKYAGISAVISMVLASGILFRVVKLHWENWYSLVPYVFGLAWVPLWVGILGIIIVRNMQSPLNKQL